MKQIDRTRRTGRGRGPSARMAGLLALLVYALLATVAQAFTVLIAGGHP